MILIAYLTEIVAFFVLFLSSVQLPEVGTVSVLAQIGLVGLLVASRPVAALDTVLRWWPLLLAPILAMASALWSDLPSVSLRYGGQFLFTAFVGVHLARLMTPHRFLLVLLLATFVFCLFSLGAGRYGPSFHGVVPIGLTGSKNAMGAAAGMMLTAAAAVLLAPGYSRTVRWIAIIGALIAAYFLVRVESTTALAIGGASVLALGGLWLLQRLQPGGRLAALIVAGLVLAPLSFLIPEGLDWLERFMSDTLDKDPTLTGRTILWAAADELAQRRPLLGYGYQAIWMGDSSDSIGLHRLSGMSDGRSFNFHNQYKQIAVDLGYVGLAAFVGALIAVALAGLRRLLLAPTMVTSFFFVTFVLMAARGSLDVIVTPLSVMTVLFYASCVYAFTPLHQQQGAQPAPAPRRWSRGASLRPRTR